MSNLTVNERLSAIVFSQRMSIIISLVSAASTLVVLLLAFIAYPVIHGENKYFAQDVNGYVARIKSADAPKITTPMVKRFAHTAVEQVFTFDYVNHDAQIELSRDLFTETGFDDFIAKINDGNSLIDQVVDTKSILTAKVNGLPISAKLKKREAKEVDWHLAMKAMFSFTQQGRVHAKQLLIDVYIKRVSTRVNPRGFAITNVLTRDLGEY